MLQFAPEPKRDEVRCASSCVLRYVVENPKSPELCDSLVSEFIFLLRRDLVALAKTLF